MDPDVRRQVGERLEVLYRRHLQVADGEVARYYRSGEGYRSPDHADGEQDVFGVCLVSTDGEVHGSGDHELSFALQSVSKVVAYGLALPLAG